MEALGCVQLSYDTGQITDPKSVGRLRQREHHPRTHQVGIHPGSATEAGREQNARQKTAKNEGRKPQHSREQWNASSMQTCRLSQHGQPPLSPHLTAVFLVLLLVANPGTPGASGAGPPPARGCLLRSGSRFFCGTNASAAARRGSCPAASLAAAGGASFLARVVVKVVKVLLVVAAAAYSRIVVAVGEVDGGRLASPSWLREESGRFGRERLSHEGRQPHALLTQIARRPTTGHGVPVAKPPKKIGKEEQWLTTGNQGTRPKTGTVPLFSL